MPTQPEHEHFEVESVMAGKSYGHLGEPYQFGTAEAAERYAEAVASTDRAMVRIVRVHPDGRREVVE